ncbi:DUF885 domain-containing protein [Georgenia sp. Z1491]|uniref:DUF885 domain-containing protein n=1 Tax=Georgenia sp. Z1491 TaxID=3416707 RepID=UPI003CF3BF31
MTTTSTGPESAPRATTAIDALAERHLAAAAALDPIDATDMGLPGHEHEWPDLTPDGVAARADLRRATLAELFRLEAADDVDAVTADVLRERLGAGIALHEAGEDLAPLNNLHGPLQNLRDTFDLMATDTAEHWSWIAERLRTLPGALAGYTEALRTQAAQGRYPSRRQVRIGVEQARELAAEDSFFTAFAAGARPDGAVASGQLAADLERGAEEARAAYGALAETIETELAPHAGEGDAVGAERYALHSRYFLGADVDLEETYAWGLEEVARLTAEQEAVAAELYGPRTTVAEAMANLDADPARTLHGTDALQEWMQATSDRAVAELAESSFDIPEPVRRLECRIAPTQTGGIYYTGPSMDFSRPGRMWWSVPKGVTEFGTWRELTTVYHEGVPGHHLQIGQTAYRSELLNAFRRVGVWVSGHGEGWALYAERLMEQLGYLDDPGDRMGMLDGQRMRAARVVLDIGVHLGLPRPADLGPGRWDAEVAWPYLQENANSDDAFLAFELDRYMTWPGQAPSYKVGQRIWEQIRDETAAREGADFDLKRFHRRALDVGSVGLDTLRRALA